MTVDRVAYVVNRFPKVSETFIAGEVAAVRRRGIDVRVLSLRPPDGGPVHDVVTREGLMRHTVYDRDAFEEVIAGFRPQVIHAHFSREPTAVARTLAALHGLPFTFTVHGDDLWREPPDDLDRRAEAAAAIVTVSLAIAEELTRRFGVDPATIHVIPCGIDVADFAPGPHRDDPPLIVAVARLRPVKRLDLLLHALAPLHGSGQPFRCRVIGDGSERSCLETLRDELGLREVVRFVGAASQEVVRDAWRTASIGALTSTSEGMPLALMEAASCGVPVVATAVGGVPELVADGETGLLVANGDVTGLTDALRRLLCDPPLRTRMAAAARARAVAHFSLDHQVDRLTALWNDVATRSRDAA